MKPSLKMKYALLTDEIITEPLGNVLIKKNQFLSTVTFKTACLRILKGKKNVFIMTLRRFFKRKIKRPLKLVLAIFFLNKDRQERKFYLLLELISKLCKVNQFGKNLNIYFLDIILGIYLESSYSLDQSCMSSRYFLKIFK